ncbi:MAG: M42 family metallopeptidase [Bacillota bacterium]|nr:M42 family metallopeptidase [Bacillota bacterium]
MKDLIRDFTQAYGPSGNEDQIREVIRRAVEPLCDRVSTDALGNLIAFRQGRGEPVLRRRVMLAAHMDEIGLIVTHIDEQGFLRFAEVGGLSAHVLMGQRVVFGNGTEGSIGNERVDEIKDLKLDKMFIDIGARSAAEAREHVEVGDMAVYQRGVSEMGTRVAAKAMDDRIGCVVIAETLRRLGESPHDIHAVFTVQEEVGLRGARTSAFAVDPHFGLAFDVTGVGDTPRARSILNMELGKGACIKAKDASLVVPPAVKNLLVKTAKDNAIPYQLEVLPAGGTDTAAIQLTRSGVPAGCISIPTRYIHSPVELLDLGDVEACVALAVKVLQGPIEV